jgi:hypothetical protein
VTGAQPAETASTNSDRAHGDAVRGALGRYLKDIEGQPLAVRTREAYAAHVSAYAVWLAERPAADAALREPRARDHAARDFKRHLKLERRWAPSSVNLALAAVDHFNRFLGLGAAVVSREQVAQAAPRALDEDDQRALLRAAEGSRPRDRAIIVVLLHTELRLSEVVALDVDDVRVSARKGVVLVRSGKGDAHREIPRAAQKRSETSDDNPDTATPSAASQPLNAASSPSCLPTGCGLYPCRDNSAANPATNRPSGPGTPTPDTSAISTVSSPAINTSETISAKPLRLCTRHPGQSRYLRRLLDPSAISREFP